MSCFLMLCSFLFPPSRIHSEQFLQSITMHPKYCFLSCFTQYIIFNRILKIIFNRRHTCLYSIINFFSNLKITSKHLTIFNWFLHMSGFGHGCEFLEKIRALFYQMACSDINNKQYICWSCHYFIFIFHVFVSLSIINLFLVKSLIWVILSS